MHQTHGGAASSAYWAVGAIKGQLSRLCESNQVFTDAAFPHYEKETGPAGVPRGAAGYPVAEQRRSAVIQEKGNSPGRGPFPRRFSGREPLRQTIGLELHRDCTEIPLPAGRLPRRNRRGAKEEACEAIHPLLI